MNTLKAFWANLREAFSLAENPFLAQERWGRERHGRTPLEDALRLVLMLVAPWLLGVALLRPQQAPLGIALASLVSLIHIPLILLAVALHCGRTFSREEQQGTLDLLLMIPARRPWLVWYKLAGPLLTGLRVAAYGLPFYLLSLFLGGVSLWTLLMLGVLSFLAALPVAGPWTFTLLYPGERGETPSRRLPSLMETFWLTCFVLWGVFILGCTVVKGLDAVERNSTRATFAWSVVRFEGERAIAEMRRPYFPMHAPEEPPSLLVQYLPLTVFVGLAEALGRSHHFFHTRLWLLPPVLLLVAGMMFNRVLAAAARLHVAAAGEGNLRRWRTVLSVGVAAGWLLLVLGYAWLPIEQGAIAYLASPLPSMAGSLQDCSPEDLRSCLSDPSVYDRIQALPEKDVRRVFLERNLLEMVNAREVRRHAMSGLLLLLLTLTAVVGGLLLIVSGPWREHLEERYRRGAGMQSLLGEVGRRVLVILAVPVVFFLGVCLCGGFSPWQGPWAHWLQYGLLTAAALVLCGSFGLWWTLAEARDPTGRSARRLVGVFLTAVLFWPLGALLTKSPAAHNMALISPLVSLALQYHPANEGLQKWYGWKSPLPQPAQVQDSGAPLVAPWWMALVLQGLLTVLFLRAAGQLARQSPQTKAESGKATAGPGWMERKVEGLLARLPAWLDNPVAFKEWRLLARQADMGVIGMLVIGMGGGLVYAVLRWPDQIPHFGTMGDTPWGNALLLYLVFIGGLLFLLGPIATGGAWAKERESGNWPFLLMTPLSDGAIVRGKLAGLMASSLALIGMALPGLVVLAAGTSLQLGATERPGMPWLGLGIGVTWFLSLTFLGSTAGLWAAWRCRNASLAQVWGLFGTFGVGLVRAALPFLRYGPEAWLAWHGCALLVEGVAAAAFYRAACGYCRQVRAGDISLEEGEPARPPVEGR